MVFIFFIFYFIYVVKTEYAYITPHGHEIGLFNSAIGILQETIMEVKRRFIMKF